MSRVVLKHVYDPARKVYSIVIADEIVGSVMMYDDDGNVMTEPGEQLRDQSGDPVFDDDGKPVYRPQPALVEAVVGHGPPIEVVFAGDDPRWFKNRKRRPLGEIAEEQRAAIRDVLDPPEEAPDASPKASEVEELPGAGQPL
jgi:hypothetical protein